MSDDTPKHYITIICEVPKDFRRVRSVEVDCTYTGRGSDKLGGEYSCKPKICGVLNDDMLEKIRDRLWEWCGKAGWLDHEQFYGIPVLRLIREMESIHCTERTYADLRASGGIHPEFYAEANEAFRGTAHRVAGELEGLARDLRAVVTPKREA